MMPESTAFLINHVLYDNNARLLTFGANSYLNMGSRHVAVKTGTTNDRRDNWTVGWSSKVIVGVWVGNNDNTPMTQVASGVTGASPIWRKIMVDVWDRYGGDDFVPPAGVESVLVDTVSGYPEHDGYPTRAEYFAKGTVPTEPDPIHTKVKVCRSDENKLASEIDAARGEYNEKEYFVLKSPSTAWQDDIQAWIATQGDQRYHVPTEYCSADTSVVVGFEKPGNNQQIDSNDVPVRLRVTTGEQVDWLRLYVDGSQKESTGGKEINKTLVLSQGVYELMGKVRLKNGQESETRIKIGVKTDPNATPSPTPTPTPSPTPTPTPTVIPLPSASTL